ncbi:MAG: ABC transporter ATP-binding protein [Candidatus Krumholzibacteriia bacterium]|nr:ABC transporter ATP-binding protein [bacterium]MCB9513648.1 ABC transporter ATP-binding protein [Candidatus Latescibacterota bacterium]
MLEVTNVDMSYGDMQVLWDVTFAVHPGEIVVLVGANGAGKSSVLKTISNLSPAKGGTIRFDGLNLRKASPMEIIEAGVIHVPEGRHLFHEMSVEENLILGAISKRAKPHRARMLDHCYSLFPRLKERRKQLSGTLSGGEQQMAAVARGLMARPAILMLDEPSLGLAPILVQDIFNIVKSVNREEGITVLLVEQNVRQTLAFCHRAYVLENGRITRSGTGEELLADPQVREAYLGI